METEAVNISESATQHVPEDFTRVEDLTPALSYDRSKIVIDTIIFAGKFVYQQNGLDKWPEFKLFFEANFEDFAAQDVHNSCEEFAKLILASGDSANNPLDKDGKEKIQFRNTCTSTVQKNLIYKPTKPVISFGATIFRLFMLIKRVKDWSIVPLYVLDPKDYDLVYKLPHLTVVVNKASAQVESLAVQLCTLTTTIHTLRKQVESMRQTKVSFAREPESMMNESVVVIGEHMEASTPQIDESAEAVNLAHRINRLRKPDAPKGIPVSWKTPLNPASLIEWSQPNTSKKRARLVEPKDRPVVESKSKEQKSGTKKSTRGTAPLLDTTNSSKYSMKTKKALKIKFSGVIQIKQIRDYIEGHDTMRHFSKNLKIDQIYANSEAQLHKVLFEEWPIDRDIIDASLWPAEIHLSPWTGKVDAAPVASTSRKWHFGGPGINPTTTAESLAAHIKGVYHGKGTHSPETGNSEFVVDVVEFNEGTKAKSRAARGEAKICNFVVKVAYKDARKEEIPDYMSTFYGSKPGHFVKSWTGKFPGSVGPSRNPFTQEAY